MLERAVAAVRRLSIRRRLVLLALVGLAAWTSVQGAREVYRSFWYWWADPWPAEAPVLWQVTSGHTRLLEAQLGRLSCLGQQTATSGRPPILAVSTPKADQVENDQGFYLYLWVAYLRPDLDVRRVATKADGLASDLWLVLGADSPNDVPAGAVDLPVACRSGDAVVYRPPVSVEVIRQ